MTKQDTRTDEELNRIIAEWMGARYFTEDGGAFWHFVTKDGREFGPPTKDLNTIHEAVQHLFKSKPGHFDGYWFCLLHEIVTGRDVIEQGWEITDSTSCSETTEATARQRAEALVAVIEGGAQ